jgi:hypothetical protein
VIPAYVTKVTDVEGDSWTREGDLWALDIDPDLKLSLEKLNADYGPLTAVGPATVEVTDAMVSAAYAELPSAAQEALEGGGERLGNALIAALKTAGFTVVDGDGEVR